MTKRNNYQGERGVFPIAWLIVVVALAGVVFVASKTGLISINIDLPKGSSPTTQQNAKLQGPTPTPTPTRLKSGSDTYSISQSSEATGPKIPTLTLDPLDPKQNEQQTITAHVTYEQPVTAVTIEYTSDNKTRTLTLSSPDGNPTMVGDWKTTWTVDDTVLYKYILKITAAAGGVKNSVEVAPRQ